MLELPAPARGTRLGGIAPHPFQDGADGNAAGAFGDEGFVFVDPGEAGDVEVNPGRVFGKDVKEFSGGDGSAVAAAGVLDVADVGLDHLGVFLAQGHAPELFAGGGEGGW